MPNWNDAPICFVYLPACPLCGASEYIHVRSASNGDGSRTERAICRFCSEPFKIVREPLPDSGNR